MALTYRAHHPRRDTAAIVETLLLQRSDTTRQTQKVNELRRRIASYEQTYGIRSDRLHAAIEDGTLSETIEVCRWIMDYELLQEAATI